MVRAISALLLLACSSSSPGTTPDARTIDAAVRDGGGSDGADAPNGGLTFDFVSSFPTATVALDEARIWLRDIRAIGDSAPGDSRTSLDESELDARDDRDPDPIAFALAPPGIYSRLDLRLGQSAGGGGRNGYELRGHVTIDTTTYELDVIDDQASDDISVALGAISVDQATTVTIAIDLSFLAGIDWASAPKDSDKITLDASEATTLGIRAGMVAAFKLP